MEAGLKPKQNNLVPVFTGILAVFVIVVSLRELRDLLLTFTIAAMLSVLFQPVILWLKRRRVPLGFALLVALTMFGFVLGLAGVMLYASSESLIDQLPAYETKFNAVMTQQMSSINALLAKFDLQLEQLKPDEWAGVTVITAETLSSALGTVFGFLADLGMMLLFMLFMLAGAGELQKKVEHAYPRSATRINDTLFTIGTAIRKYLGIQVLLGAGVGLLTGLILWGIGVDFAFFWGCLAFVMSFVPYVGVVIAAGAPFALASLQFDSAIQPLLVLFLLGGLQFIVGNVLNPKLMSASLNLSLLLVLASLVFWGWLWGPWGMILAVPITASIRIALANIEPFRPLSILMSEQTDVKWSTT